MRAGGADPGGGVLRLEGINLGGAADAAVDLAAEYPYEKWAGHFYQAMTEAARLGLRISCLVSRDLEYALTAYEAIDREVSIRNRRWVLVHVNQASDDQLQRMRALGVVVTATPGFLAMASDRYGLDRLGSEGVPLP